MASSTTTRKVGSIDPVSDFQAMMASAIAGDEGGPVRENKKGLAQGRVVDAPLRRLAEIFTRVVCPKQAQDEVFWAVA